MVWVAEVITAFSHSRKRGKPELQSINRQHVPSIPALVGMIVVFILIAFSTYAQDTKKLLPNKTLTPGQIRSTDVEEICQPGYSKSVRRTSRKLKRSIYKKYGLTKQDRYQGGKRRYKIDHLIPLSIGGSDNAPNLWPSPLFPQPMNAYDKDRLEFRLYRMVCHEGYDVRQAQKDIQDNWLVAFEKYCSAPDSCPSFVTYMESIGKPVR